ncbi:hypothetical protein CFP56_036429 [Quercus suber]|uniref:Uncharacterized protein n=1 Tax=Quercus suber TaxID=58331 RepID=A0AAW0LNX9_QUESU
MPLTRFSADAFGVVTICLVALLILLGLLCIIYSFYFRSRIRSQGFIQLSYFSGPWIIRITFILFAIWWGFGEVIRLSLLRRALNLKWQETVCKCYIVSNLGFAEPCLFLTLVFLLRAPLQKMELGILSRSWNGKTAGETIRGQIARKFRANVAVGEVGDTTGGQYSGEVRFDVAGDDDGGTINGEIAMGPTSLAATMPIEFN